MRLKLTYINVHGCACIEHPHYDLYYETKYGPINVACLLLPCKESKKIIKKMIDLYNKSLK